MTDADLPVFIDTFSRVRKIFPLRGGPSEIDQIASLYFGALRRHPLHAVTTAADVLISTGQHFPKPAQWLDAIPTRLSATLPEMTPNEAREHQRAEDLHYEDEPCRCFVCVDAGVSHRFLRYVPDEDEDGHDVRMILAGRIVARGHWAHGEELARWYEAKDRFWGQYAAMIAVRSMPRVSQAQIEAEGEEHTIEAALDRAVFGDHE